MVRSENFYINRLTKYFDTHFQEYTETAEWYTDPAPNQWKFELPGIGVVILTCSDDGEITKTIKVSGDRTP